MKKLSLLVAFAAGALLLDAMLGTQSVHAQSTGSSGNVALGKQAFMHYGCYECHGTVGEGNFGAGPAIAPHPIPYDGFLAYIRAPRGEMPPFDAHVLPPADAQNIFAYLSSLPDAPSVSSVSALQFDTGNAGAATPVSPQIARGREVFATYCVKCHVSAPIGPALANVKAHETLAQTLAQIKNPAPPMPKLYPATINERDVNAVAAYVQTL